VPGASTRQADLCVAGAVWLGVVWAAGALVLVFLPLQTCIQCHPQLFGE
jgi:hypothetical protein